MRARVIVSAVAIAATATLTLGTAAPAAAPAASKPPAKFHVHRVPVQPMHSMCGGEVV
jgi:hypothetical protein